MLHDELWRSNFGLAQSCLSHPFVEALSHGTLASNLFRRFIAQDAFFLNAFLKAYALALARSDGPETTAVLCDLIGGVREELKLHRTYASDLGIDLDQTVPNPACRAYTNFLLSTAWHTSLGETVAAMTPCMRLYAYLGGELASKCGPGHPYRTWIESYSGEEFGRLAAHLEALLDRVGADTRDVREAYRYALQCEVDFFSDAFRP
jgi:thiaminase/transcriptional activator TenA